MTLPVSIVVPTRNCRPLLSRYLDTLVRCSQLVEQVVVVDSQSTDGSLEFLQWNLRHPHVRFLSVPPGLYRSWNRGLRECTSRYSYLATAGDIIDPEGLRHLVEVAERFQADAVLSPPTFVSEEGRRFPRKEWSLHQYLDRRGVSEPMKLPRSHVFVSSLVHGLAGFMGSSASNLYRTDALQKHPFPTEFGHVGDTAWGVAGSLGLRMALTPRRCAEHVLHEPSSRLTQHEFQRVNHQLSGLARHTLARNLASGALPAEAGGLTHFLDELSGIRQPLNEATQRFDGIRQQNRFWILDPSAVSARIERDRHRRRLQQLWRGALCRFGF